ncbi:MAG: hypothetical protein HGA36_04910 [Candidatus Moranbacteria bacterium]|nr:hypothetical protein [Candidatus Moranbacteria bacterium]
MNYEEYWEKIKNFVKESTLSQRIFAGIVMLIFLSGYIVYINPAKKLLEMRNSQRRADIVSILNVVYQYGTKHEGVFPMEISENSTAVCRTGALSCEGLLDLSQILADNKALLSKIPVDPNEKNSNSSGYEIFRQANGRIGVSAPLAENGAVIKQSK